MQRRRPRAARMTSLAVARLVILNVSERSYIESHEQLRQKTNAIRLSLPRC